jgi:hypothetical protein
MTTQQQEAKQKGTTR